MSEADSAPARPLDKGPFLWMLAILAAMGIGVLAFQFAGEQKLHNGALWQRLHPVTRASPPQTATPVEVVDQRRIGYVVVQTERGLYFLTGAKYVPAPGSKVVVQANDRWDLFLCAADGERCMSIHSFCSDVIWPNLQRDAQGRLEGCFAPRTVDAPMPDGPEIQPLAAVPGGIGKSKRLPPARGLSHPREWAWRMGLPSASN